MENKIFREKSLERVSSPEQLNDYIKVTGPSIWLLLGAIMVLLAGALVFAVFGRLETKLSLPVISGENGAICYVRENQVDEIEPGMTAQVDGTVCELSGVGAKPVRAAAVLDDYALHLGGFEANDWVYPVELGGELPEGTYAASVTLESLPAISFILN